ncbi:MAG: Slp family lipoprotein [Candidatus Manganitrophus sp. SB1]|nr:Slp family lipoprotein [Candidatus Manganitrophus morganii]
MKKKLYSKMPAVLLLFLSSLIFSSCGQKVIPEDLERKVEKEISFQEVKKNPESYKGKRILVGGEIIEIRNLQNKTEIEILQKPLGRDRAPITVDESGGRFVLIHPSFLDPSVFRSGRRLTAVGLVEGGRSEQVGEAEMVQPVLQSEHIHLWPPGEGGRSEPSIGIGLGFGFSF